MYFFSLEKSSDGSKLPFSSQNRCHFFSICEGLYAIVSILNDCKLRKPKRLTCKFSVLFSNFRALDEDEYDGEDVRYERAYGERYRPSHVTDYLVVDKRGNKV